MATSMRRSVSRRHFIATLAATSMTASAFAVLAQDASAARLAARAYAGRVPRVCRGHSSGPGDRPARYRQTEGLRGPPPERRPGPPTAAEPAGPGELRAGQ